MKMLQWKTFKHVMIYCCLTGGLAAPLVIGGAAAAIGGGAVSVGADIAGSIMSSNEVKAAQQMLDNDKSYLTKINENQQQFQALVNQLSKHLDTSPDQLYGAILMFSQRDAGPGIQGTTNALLGLKVLALGSSIAKKILPKNCYKCFSHR